MPDASIAVSLKDLYTSGVKSMTDRTKAFSKEADTMIGRLRDLGTKQDELVRKQSKLKTSLEDARKELNQAQKAYKANSDEINRTNLERATEQFETLQEQLRSFRDESSRVRREASQLQSDLSKMDNRAGSGGIGGSSGSLLGTLGKAGLLNMAGTAASQWANALAGSAFGSTAGTLFSGALSGAATGAALGSIIPGIGTVVGAAVGGGLGLLTSGAQVYEERDEAFKSYVQEAYEGQLTEQETSLGTGSTLAAQRETDKISFSTLFKDAGIAETYLADLVTMANNTPFLYDDLTTMSKTLATYGFGAQADSLKIAAGEKDFNYILDVLQTIGDTGAALGQSTSDMTMVATAIGRMKSSNKTTLEYLNILNDRGIGAVGMLADAYGVDQGKMYDMISKGEVEGTKAAEIILQAMTDSFSGSMLQQSQTFSGLTSTVEGLTQELDNAMGEGYNEGRMAGLAAQRDWLSGESGEAVEEANRAIGAWQAELENQKEQYIRDAVDAMMASEEYQSAKEAGDAAEMGRLIMQAKVQGMNEYNASEGAQEALAAEKALVENIRNDTSLNQDYWDAGYEKGQWFTKGLAAAWGATSGSDETILGDWSFNADLNTGSATSNVSKRAVGIDYVPYDNFPALLHQGERVQTAVEARSERSSRPVVITGNNFTVREDADISRIAAELLTQMELAESRG